jgi:hypothetical protein
MNSDFGLFPQRFVDEVNADLDFEERVDSLLKAEQAWEAADAALMQMSMVAAKSNDPADQSALEAARRLEMNAWARLEKLRDHAFFVDFSS